MFIILVVGIFLGSIFSGSFSSLMNTNTLIVTDESQLLKGDLRLMSLQPPSRNESFNMQRSKRNSSLYSGENNPNSFNIEYGTSRASSNNTVITLPNFQISSTYDVVIDEISPEAMEKNATTMEFLLNFTIINGLGQTDSALTNLTLRNTSDSFLVTDWSDWINVQDDKYSLMFTVDNLMITNLDLGTYDLFSYIGVYSSGWHNSSDSISLPMKDLQVYIHSISPSKFNNKLDADQFFNITIDVWEDDGMGSNPVLFLPAVLDENLDNTNPNATIISGTQAGVSGPLQFVNFIGDNITLGRYTFNVSLSASVAASFDDYPHNLTVEVSSREGIIANDNYYPFEAEGTVLIVWLKDIIVESRDTFYWDTLTNYGQEHTEFRLNVNDSISFSYEVINNGTDQIETEKHLIYYRDPNKPGDPFALISNQSRDDGTGTITLVANDYTDVSSGYTVLFSVLGHKSSQETRTSNITIYWDKLYYQFTYKDNLGESGSSGSRNEKALGVDVGEPWLLELSIYYLSDDSPAKSSHVSYRFSKTSPWQNLTDGVDGDSLDGILLINYTSFIATVLPFECRIVNGSNTDQYETYFVNKTEGNASFNFNVTWTYLLIEMTPIEEDSRLGTGTDTGINISARWAHDNSSFNSILIGKGHDRNILKDVKMENGTYKWLGLLKTAPGIYRYSILNIAENDKIEEDPYGISKFTNTTNPQPDERMVYVDIIWDDVYFTFSNVYNTSIPPSEQQTWGTDLFFANFGENTTLYCYGRHSYNITDNTSFQGTAFLYDFDNGQKLRLDFDENGIANISINRTDARRAVLFRVMNIESEPNWDVKQIWLTDSNYVEIVWDKIIITLKANQRYSHGSWANISVSLGYEISISKTIDTSEVNYSILFRNGTTYENISWIYFLDYSFNSTFRWYNITNIYDSDTGVTVYEIFFEWLDKDHKEEGNLTIYWIDDRDPSILELHLVDRGNGTILIIVDVTDDSENWEGNGIAQVTLSTFLYDQGRWEDFPGKVMVYSLPSGALLYIFKYSYNQWFEESGWYDTFQFEFGDPLKFNVNVTDNRTPDFPGNFEPASPRTASVGLPSIIADYDPYSPQFKMQNGISINVTYKTMDISDNLAGINDGDVIITIIVQDNIWSGLNKDSVQLVITDQKNFVVNSTNMVLYGDELGERMREELKFIWEGNLPVFETYEINITVTDNAGNKNSRISEVSIEDNVAPRIISVDITPTDDRNLEVTIELEETGAGIAYVMVEVISAGGTSHWYNLSAQGGIGGQQTSSSYTYSAIIPIDFTFTDMINYKTYSIQLNVSDRTGNLKHYNSADLDILGVNKTGTLPPIIIQYLLIVLFFSGIILITAIVVGIKVFSKTEGYDMKKIITESERITREVILTQMDEYALGVTVNFFDQVQGPVPVIWEPPLLEDQEQVMLDLSDKSFSTLEFVGLEETERSGTFDFSTGSYECTALGYSFAIANPKARGGKENLTVVLLLRKEWGDNLLVFQDELLEKIRDIRNMIESEQHSSQIEKEARQLREYVSRLMLAFNNLYVGTDHESDSSVE